MRHLLLLALLLFSLPVGAEEQISRIQFFGNNAISSANLQRASGVRRYDFYKDDTCESAIARLTRIYAGLGYSGVDIKCRLRGSYLLIKVIEGKQDRVRSIGVIQGGADTEHITKILSPITARFIDRPVSPEVLRDWKGELLFALRKEGYLFSSLQLELLEGSKLNIGVNPRTPVSISIVGNSAVSNRDILALLQIADRLSPITIRSIEGLPEQIHSLYAERGYPFSEVKIVKRGEEGQAESYQLLIEEGDKTFISDVVIQSEVTVPGISYKDIISTKPRRVGPLSWIEPGILNKEKVASDLATLEEVLKAAGYLDATADYKISPTDSGLIVTFAISPGRQYLVEHLRKEVDCPPEAGAIAVIDPVIDNLKSGIATDEKISLKKLEIRERLINLGFPSPITDFKFDRLDSTLGVSIRCGNRQEVGSIQFEGLVHTDESYLRGLLRTEPGDSIAKLDHGIERIRATGIFASVDVRLDDSALAPLKPGYQRKDIKIIFRERDTGVLGASVSLNTEDGLRIGGELSQRNFRAKAETLSLSADLFINDRDNPISAGRAKAFWRVPTVFGEERLEFLTEGYAQYDVQNVNQFSFDRLGVDSQFRLTVRKFAFSLGASFFQDDVYDVPADIIVSDRDLSRTFYSFITGKIEFGGRDNELSPGRGFYSTLSGKVATEALGGDADLGILTLDTRHYLPLSSELVWANGVRGTKMVPFGNSEVIPLSQRLFLGGANSLRGFTRNRLSPLGVSRNRAGGDESFVLNSELQWNLTDTFQLASFVDAGEVKLENGGESLGSTDTGVRVSPGVGVRYRTPVGPLGIDIGFPLDRRDGEASPRLYFGFNGIF